LIEDSSFKDLKRELVIATLTGSYQTREQVYQDQKHPRLRVYIYKENNHKKPHVHVYWNGDEAVSLCIKTQETLAGEMDSKFLKIVIKWILANELALLEAWEAIQQGRKPEALWAE